MLGLAKLIVGATMIVVALIVGSTAAPPFPHGPHPAQASPPSQAVATLVGPQRIVVRDLPPLQPPGPAQERAQRRHRAPIGLDGGAAAPAANVTDASFSAGAPQPLAAPTTSTTQFEGLDNNDNANLSGFIVTPPDPQMAVGPNHVFEMVNIVGRIYTRAGATVESFTLASFFGVPAGFNNTDPKIIYDALSSRWFASYVSLVNNGGANNDQGRLHIGVSETSDPTGAWNVYDVVYAKVFPDYAAIGVTGDKLTASSNIFDIDGPPEPVTAGCSSVSGYCGEQTIVFEKADLLAGAPGPGVCGPGANVGVCFLPASGPPFNTARFTVRPAHSLSSLNDQYLTVRGSSTTLTLIRITGTPDAGNVSEASAINLTMLAQNEPPASAAMGGNIDSGDFRLLETVWRNGHLWTSASAACIPAGDSVSRSCAHLIEVDTTTNTVVQDIMFGAAGEYYSWPAVRTDASGDLYVSLTHTNSAIFAEARSAGRLASDPPNTMTGSVLLRAGQVAHTSGRWGDYLGAAVDPTFPECVWLVGEYAKNTPYSSNWDWGTYIAASSYSNGCDGDNDRWTDGEEAYIGSLSGLACPATVTANDEDPDAWAPDFNDDRRVNGLDVFQLSLHFNSQVGDSKYTNRADLNADGAIDGLDVFRISQVFNNTCPLP